MDVAKKVKEIIVEQLGIDESAVAPDASFIEDLGADSLDAVELVMVIEEEFRIDIPDEIAETLVRVRDVVEYIESRVNQISRTREESDLVEEVAETGSLEDKYRKIEREFWRDTEDKTGSPGSDFAPIYQALVPKIGKAALAEKLDEWEYEVKLRKAETIIDDIAYALKWNVKDALVQVIWYSPDEKVLEKPDAWTAASPVNTFSLDAATARYLNEPWMQLNLIDWYVLNGFIYDQLARLAEEIRSGIAFGRTNWAYVFAEGKLGKTIMWQMGLSIARFIFRWLLLPAIAAMAYYFGYNEFSKWTLIAFGIYIVVHFLFFPKRISQRRKLKKGLSYLNEKLDGMRQIYMCTNVRTLHPTNLRAQIANLEKDQPCFPPAVYSILDRAIQRDPSVFTID